MDEPAKDDLAPNSSGPPSKNRVALWIIGAGVGIYLLGTGVWGIITG